ncbi:hypothetical protein POKO110462_16045 [Pontibacter korlensis]|uniref:Uncharacterized protein n=1 Tax=Pontibacter korlensis TaxID=400092 RepID=A0A0E3ZE37_9BACT|nr:hypothetical protein [Pontibacter korlensis]AKD03550.1 hypothetical protein PKOR_10920 [Pontibacter korlensis]
MKTKSILPNLILGVFAVAVLTFIYFVGKDFGHFLAGLRGEPEMSASDVVFNIGYSLGYIAIPVVTLLLLYMAYRFSRKGKKKRA